MFPARSSHPFGRTFVSFHASFRSTFVPGVPSTFPTHLFLLHWTFDVAHDAPSHVDRFVRRRRNAERRGAPSPATLGGIWTPRHQSLELQREVPIEGGLDPPMRAMRCRRIRVCRSFERKISRFKRKVEPGKDSDGKVVEPKFVVDQCCSYERGRVQRGEEGGSRANERLRWKARTRGTSMRREKTRQGLVGRRETGRTRRIARANLPFASITMHGEDHPPRALACARPSQTPASFRPPTHLLGFQSPPSLHGASPSHRLAPLSDFLVSHWSGHDPLPYPYAYPYDPPSQPADLPRISSSLIPPSKWIWFGSARGRRHEARRHEARALSRLFASVCARFRRLREPRGPGEGARGREGKAASPPETLAWREKRRGADPRRHDTWTMRRAWRVLWFLAVVGLAEMEKLPPIATHRGAHVELVEPRLLLAAETQHAQFGRTCTSLDGPHCAPRAASEFEALLDQARAALNRLTQGTDMIVLTVQEDGEGNLSNHALRAGLEARESESDAEGRTPEFRKDGPRQDEEG